MTGKTEETTRGTCRCAEAACGCKTATVERCTCGERCACRGTCRCGEGCGCATKK